MNYTVERAENAGRDLNAILDFLIKTYVEFGEDAEAAIDGAERRLQRIEAAMRALGRAPHQGTLRPELQPGLRSVTKDSAIFYFDVNDDLRVVRVLAVFFGGQDHQRLMLRRLLERR